jgi:hypothetical protein
MKRFKITSTHFVGEVEILYNEAGDLCYLNMVQAKGEARILKILLYQIPLSMKKLPKPNDISVFKMEEVTV